jgi:hypothetical protein|tara:strand:- start:390 stop:614 length:225 start_codon:yes stop_codon:yes gene_type:complete
MAPKTYDYYHNEQYYKIAKGKIFVWRIDEWITSTIEIYELIGGKTQQFMEDKKRDQRKRRREKEKERIKIYEHI